LHFHASSTKFRIRCLHWKWVQPGSTETKEQRRVKEEGEKKFREMMEIKDRARAEERERMKRLREETRGTYLKPESSTKVRDNERNKRRCFG